MTPGMDVRIHRGATEIGGSCVEVRCAASTILLDLGTPLWASREDPVGLPAATGLGEPGPPPLALLISHGHQDHWGLAPQLFGSIPVWIGAGAAEVLRAAEFWGTGIDLQESGHLKHRQPFQVGPFTITPYLADHSGFDAYSLLIEGGGARLFYSGDLRGHGRKHRAFEWLLDDPPTKVDALLLEGTNVRSGLHAASLPPESAIEDNLVQTLAEHPGLGVVIGSAQNVDRLVTVYRAALRSDRRLAVDLNTAEVAAATRRDSIPRPGTDWPRVAVYVPHQQRVRVKTTAEFERIQRVRAARIFHEDITAAPAQWLLYGAFQSAIPLLLAHGLLRSGVVAWSLWEGYLKKQRGQDLVARLAGAGVPLVTHHTSGHASVEDLQRLVRAIEPAIVVPIHTESPEQFAAVFHTPVVMHSDGHWWHLPTGTASTATRK